MNQIRSGADAVIFEAVFSVAHRITFEQVRGYLDDDIVIFDDAIDLVRAIDSIYGESRKYLELALDTTGDNRLTKRLVGIPSEHALQYYPRCTIIIFFQPYLLPEEAFLSGLFRRFITMYIQAMERDRVEIGVRHK